nr:MAG: hypothetical protein B6I27_02965 [Erwiniaceae bacterium 4572_131]
MNADETISIRPFIDLLEASIKKWELNLRNYEIKKNEKEYQWIMKEKPILPYQTYTDKDVRKKAVERHFNDLASEEGNQDLKKIFDFIDRNKEYQYYIYNQYHLEDLFNKVKNKYPNNLENNSNDELRKLLIVNGIIREMPVRGGGKKYTFAFLYKYRLGLRNRRP